MPVRGQELGHGVLLGQVVRAVADRAGEPGYARQRLVQEARDRRVAGVTGERREHALEKAGAERRLERELAGGERVVGGE
jgi:hypothetical protein